MSMFQTPKILQRKSGPEGADPELRNAIAQAVGAEPPAVPTQVVNTEPPRHARPVSAESTTPARPQAAKSESQKVPAIAPTHDDDDDPLIKLSPEWLTVLVTALTAVLVHVIQAQLGIPFLGNALLGAAGLASAGTGAAAKKSLGRSKQRMLYQVAGAIAYTVICIHLAAEGLKWVSADFRKAEQPPVEQQQP